MTMKNCTLLLLLLMLGYSSLTAQENEETTEQAQAKVATPPNMWELSPNFGYFFVAGDVDAEFGWGAGLSVRKATDYIFSLRGDLFYGQANGNNNDGSGREFEMNVFSGTVLGVFALNSMRFDKPIRKSHIYAMAGAGANFFEVPEYSNEEVRKASLDREFQTHATLGAGIAFRISPRFNIGIEHQASLVFGNRADKLDGTDFGGNFRDVMNYTNIRLGFNLGNPQTKAEPLYWINPLQVVLDDIDELRENQNNLTLEDTDGDGVIDQIDAEPGTAPGALVDTKGRTLDSDRDGVPDHLDQEPYYTPREGENVNAQGVVENPVSSGGVSEERVRELIDEALQDYEPSRAGGGMTDLFLPMIHFGINSSTVKYSDYGTLASIARVLKANPDVRMIVRGYTDQTGSETYNTILSYERSKAIIDHLVTNHGIGRGRLVLQYGGQDDALVPANSSYMNRRVEFFVAGPDDVEMDPPENYNKNNSNDGY